MPRKTVFLAALLFLLPAGVHALPRPQFELASAGPQEPVDYSKYGTFENTGTEDYVYRATDLKGLAKASGKGVPPDDSLKKDPAFLAYAKAHRGEDPWKRQSGAPEEDFYAWSQDAEGIDDGARLFYAAEALRRGGHVVQALKAYHAIVVLYPKAVVWSADASFYWYVAPEAISRARKLCATYPELGFRLEGAFVDVRRGAEGTPESDRVRTRPGAFVKTSPAKTDPDGFEIVGQRGNGKVRAVRYKNGGWRLLVDGKPFVVKGVTYTCTTVGESAHALNLRPWMRLDDDKNGKNDGMFDSWIDDDRDGRRGPQEPVVGDAALLERMGANAIRVYHGVDAWGKYQPEEYDKALMRTLQKDFGIYFIMGDFAGAYTVGSQARWDAGTDYSDEEQKASMLASIRAMVTDHKDEPYVLMWLLGNENQHPNTHTNAYENPEAYARFLNEAAKMIHELDPDHPVAVCNLNFQNLAELGKFAPEIDIYGANIYSGAYSMGSVWHLTKEHYDRPMLITEFGCDAYAHGRGPDEEAQADYFRQNWEDIVLNMPGNRGEGNAIGGVVFEWMDEWWKTGRGDAWGDPFVHNVESDTVNPFPDSRAHEEWLGVMGQGDGEHSHFLREKRRVYDEIARAWNGRDFD